MFHEKRDVLLPFPERRRNHRDDVQAVVQVVPERPSGKKLFQPPVGGGDDADVGFPGDGLPHPLVFPFLDHAQQLRLQVRADLGNLVQEERSPLPRFSNRPALSFDGSRECPRTWPNSSLSMECSRFREAQFTPRNGLLRAGTQPGG